MGRTTIAALVSSGILAAVAIFVVPRVQPIEPSVARSPLASFATGQEADLLLSGYGFNQTGGALSFNHPQDMDSDGTRLVVADTFNNRVLLWDVAPVDDETEPDIVLCQTTFSTNTPGDDLGECNWPAGVAMDGERLYVADTENDRVLVWDSIPTVSGTPADFAITQDLRWPWDVWSDGTRLAITNTQGSNVLIWQVPPIDDRAPDMSLVSSAFGTPRKIESDGVYLAIGDHNAQGQTSDSGVFLWDAFPTAPDAPFDNFLPGHGEASPLVALDSSLQGISNTGDVHAVTQANSREYVLLYNAMKILVDYDTTSEFTIGNDVSGAQYITNGVPVSNGTSLVVSSDFDRQLAIWENLPTESNQAPSIVIETDFPAWDNALHDQTLILAGQKQVAIWNTLPFQGEAPTKTYKDKIGSLNFDDLRGVAYDGEYFSLADDGTDRIYVWHGLPLKGEAPWVTLSVDEPRRLSSNGAYLVVTSTLDNDGGHIKVFSLSNLADTTQPTIIDQVPTNLPETAMVSHGMFFIADTIFNRILGWTKIEDALSGEQPDFLLGATTLNETEPSIAEDALFWPAGIDFDGTHLWIGEFKFSNRLVRFSTK